MRKMSPNSLANLEKGKFKKGKDWNGNNKGVSLPPKEIRDAKTKLRNDFDAAVIKFTDMSYEDLGNFLKEKKGKSLEMAIAACLYKAIGKGENNNLNFFMDRIIGRAKQQVEVTGRMENINISDDQVLKMAEQIITDADKK